MDTIGTLEIHPRARPGGAGYTAAGSLPVGLLLRALADARAQGYREVVFAGEEPLLYKALPSLLARARKLGMSRTLQTCGAQLDSHRLLALAGLEFVWVAVDAHMGGACPRGYRGWDTESLVERLRGLSDLGIPFGLTTTCTGGLRSLVGVAGVAMDCGAERLRVDTSGGAGLDSRIQALIAAMQLVAYFGDRLTIELDGFDCAEITASVLPIHGEALPSLDEAPDAMLAELVDRLIIRGDGVVVPRHLEDEARLGDLCQMSLDGLVERWLSGDYDRFRARCRWVLGRVMSREDVMILEEYRELVSGFEACRTGVSGLREPVGQGADPQR